MNVSPWQHSRIIKAFLYQGESQKALQYIRTKQPAMETLNDVKLHLSVLLTNGLTAEAFHFQRLYRDQENAEELLYHLFLGAQQTKTVDNLLKLPLSQMEESTLISYLKDSTEPNSVELLVMHYLQRARYVEAIRLNETLKHSLMSETDIKARERASARNAIVDSYTKLLPRVQRKLAYAPEQPMRKLTMARREVIRPKPLSTVVNRSGKSQVISHATLLNAVLDKISEARCQTRDDETPIKRRLSESAPSITEADPFVGTPVTPRSKTVLSDKRSLVYPQIMYSEDSSPQMKPSSPRIQRLYSTSPQQSVNLSSPPMFMDQMKRRVSDFTSAAALSLLCTPPVRKRTPGSLRKTKTPQPTPQSILKVRKPIRTTSSPGEDISGPPSPAQESPDIKPKQLSAVFKGNITLETPPRFHRKKASFAVTVEPKPETPRHIRFAFDDKQDVSLKDENSLSLPEDSVMPSVEIANDSDAMATEADIVLNDNSDLELRLDESQDDSMVVDDEVSFHRRGDTSHRTMDDSEEMEEELTQEYQPAAEIKDTEEDVIEVEEVLHADEDEVAVLEDEVREVSPEDEDEDVVKEDVAIELVMEDSIPAQDVGAPSPKRESSPEMLILDESDEEEEEELPPLVARETDEEKKFEEDADILEVPEERKVEEKSTTDEKTQKEDFVMEQQDLLRAEEPVSEAVAVQFEKQETRPEADTEISQDVVEVESEGTDQTEVTVPEELIETRPGKVEDDGTTEVDAEQRYATTDETLTVLPEKTPVLQPQELPVSPEAGDVPAMMTTPKRPPPKIQATVFEMGVQTTPGLSLRQPHRMGTPSYADAFRASLRSERRIRRRKLPDGTEKAPDSSVPEVEVTIPEVSETAASVSETAPWVSEPETSVSETPDPASTDTDTVMETTTDDASVMQTTEDETGEESKTEDDVEEMAYTFSEPLTLSKNEDSVAATPTSGTSSTPRFVFSPPLTRSQLRRKQRLDTPESSGAGDGSSPGLPFLSAEMKEGKSSSASRRVTRTRKSSRLSLQPPSDSPINFISPVVSELASNANKRKTRRSIRIASSKSLLDEPLVEEKTTTTKVRRAKTRSGKLWSNV
uniref:Protein ELYS-like n=1 Tax=Saccoglossus kowalevskii TaxID=10224 RepID=A0ABM0MRC2_SACKO|nr:PREDICTED: protein ELYS-like [Saccoglossus kowalevskii]